MLRSANPSQTELVGALSASSDAAPVNSVSSVDDFVTAEPTPKSESRRGWRRRRVRRGKS